MKKLLGVLAFIFLHFGYSQSNTNLEYFGNSDKLFTKTVLRKSEEVYYTKSIKSCEIDIYKSDKSFWKTVPILHDQCNVEELAYVIFQGESKKINILSYSKHKIVVNDEKEKMLFSLDAKNIVDVEVNSEDNKFILKSISKDNKKLISIYSLQTYKLLYEEVHDNFTFKRINTSEEENYYYLNAKNKSIVVLDEDFNIIDTFSLESLDVSQIDFIYNKEEKAYSLLYTYTVKEKNICSITNKEKGILFSTNNFVEADNIQTHSYSKIKGVDDVFFVHTNDKSYVYDANSFENIHVYDGNQVGRIKIAVDDNVYYYVVDKEKTKVDFYTSDHVFYKKIDLPKTTKYSDNTTFHKKIIEIRDLSSYSKSGWLECIYEYYFYNKKEKYSSKVFHKIVKELGNNIYNRFGFSGIAYEIMDWDIDETEIKDVADIIENQNDENIEENNGQVTIYPNAFRESISIKSANPDEAMNIVLVNQLGQIVGTYHTVNTPTYVIETTRLVAGAYFVIIKTNTVQYSKIIIKH